MDTIESYKSDHLIGIQIGTSTILSELARGGMAIVFIAYQRTLKRRIAVKILPKIFLNPTAAELFQQEAEAAAILSHPNIIPIYDTFNIINTETDQQLVDLLDEYVRPAVEGDGGAIEFDRDAHGMF